MIQQSTVKGHPRGLYILFATEMWERFNFYGMRAMLVLFMTQALLFENEFASNLYGSYIGMIYLSPLIGGYIADRYWGNQRSIIAGGIIMAIGEVFLFFCGSTFESSPGLAQALFYAGLGFMITGNGFFKPNISSLVGQLYPYGDNRKDAAYTIFYMGINTGGALGPLICGLVGNTGNPADFKWAFLIGGIAMILSVIVQILFHKKYVLDPNGNTLGLVPADCPKKFLSLPLNIIALTIISAIIVGLFYIDAKKFSYMIYLLSACFILIPAIIYSDKSLTKKEKNKVAVITVVCFFVIFFWGAYEQTGASLVFFAQEQTDRIVNLKIPLWLIAGLSAIGIWYLFVLFKKTSVNLASHYDSELRKTLQFLLVIAGIALVLLNIYLFSNFESRIDFREIPTSWFQSLNSIFIVLFAPFFAIFWLKLGKKEPSSPTKMALGLLFVALGYLWIAWGVNSAQPGIKVSMIWLTVLYALHTAGELCLSPIGLSLVNKLSPLKFASLLMAVWFTANAFGNKIAGSLSALYPEKGKPTNFLGYHMSNLYDFFMLFVFMCGIAALILFVLTRKLQKMMNE